MIRKSIVIILATLIPLGVLAFFIHAASAATALIGCSPTSLTVKTGQTFYITVAVTNTTDLYAWQMDATYYPAYLEYVAIFSGEHLRIDGASDYLVKPVIISGSTVSEMTSGSGYSFEQGHRRGRQRQNFLCHFSGD